MDRRLVVLVGVLFAEASAVVASARSRRSSADSSDGWSVTAWGERYEVFAETGPLVAGAAATSGAHVTELSGFAPLKEGVVTLIMRSPAGADEAFRQDRPRRDGIFPVEVKPRAEGTFDLVFRVESPAGREDVAAGSVRSGRPPRPADASARKARRRRGRCRS
jgi:hypothetical protein